MRIPAVVETSTTIDGAILAASVETAMIAGFAFEISISSTIKEFSYLLDYSIY